MGASINISARTPALIRNPGLYLKFLEANAADAAQADGDARVMQGWGEGRSAGITETRWFVGKHDECARHVVAQIVGSAATVLPATGRRNRAC